MNLSRATKNVVNWKLMPKKNQCVFRKYLFFVGVLFGSLSVASQEKHQTGAVSKLVKNDSYCFDSIDVLYVKNPDLALIRIDSLRRRCQANGWTEYSRPRLEMINSIIYTYKEDPGNTLRYAYVVLSVTEDLSEPDNLFWRLMALQYSVLPIHRPRTGL